MANFKYQIGEECWAVVPGYGYEFYRCVIIAKLTCETKDGLEVSYRVKIEGQLTLTDVEERHLFDVATRSLDALCFLHDHLRAKQQP